MDGTHSAVPDHHNIAQSLLPSAPATKSAQPADAAPQVRLIPRAKRPKNCLLQRRSLPMITSHTTDESLKILRLPQVCEVTGLCRSMIYQLEADLRFPQRVKIGVRAVGWLDKEVNAWLMKRIALSRTKTAVSS